MTIALICIGASEAIQWSLGAVYSIAESPLQIASLIGQILAAQKPDGFFFWDVRLGQPDLNVVSRLSAQTNIDVWHAGLRLSLQGLPYLLDCVQPTWMLACDADPSIESSSWRLSLRACLIRSEVLEQVGSLQRDFISLEAAGLALGHRMIQYGVIMRYTPDLVPPRNSLKPALIPLSDEFRFIDAEYGDRFTLWAAARAILSRYADPFSVWRSVRNLPRQSKSAPAGLYQRTQIDLETVPLEPHDYSVSVLIATLDRYDYLRVLLPQLRKQTVPPLEILIIDQTESARRETTLADEFPDLPLRVFYLDEQGQVTSRNLGLQESRGDYILFVDDDDEVKVDLIEQHLKNLSYFQADTSSGAVDEVGALPPASIFSRTRLSDVFPTNNTLIRKSVLCRSGLFDLAFQRRQSEDGDLGTRIHLAGALMIYNPQIEVFHHRAPHGGLRAHKARVITYSSSRQRLFHRRFPHVSEVYIAKRYYSARQVTEAFWIILAGTFSIRGSRRRKLLKILISLALLPDSIYRLIQRHKGADQLLQSYPQIPELDCAKDHP